MKSQFLALPLTLLLPACALAQTQAVPVANMASTSVEPQAQTLLNSALSTYKNASGLQLSIANSKNGKDTGAISMAFARPNLLDIKRQSGKSTLNLLLDGSDFYVVQGANYSKTAVPEGGPSQLIEGTGGATGEFVSAMLDGKNPLDVMTASFSAAPFKNYTATTVALPARLVDGDVLRGIQNTSTFGVAAPDGTVRLYNQQLTAWFGGSPLVLRRMQTRSTRNGKTTTGSERIFDQKISPTFTPDAFKFNATGLKLASDDANSGDQKYFDARLKVGASPFAFASKSLGGAATITPANYKGKVLLLDFWATWCGPCVASLPELKGAYDKYHAQGLEVVGISLDEDKKSLTSFIKAKNMAWPQIFDGKGWGAEVPGIYGVKAIPFMLIIGKDGKIAAVNPRGNIDAAVKAALAAS